MLTGGPNYMMIRRAIFGKVHGRGVKRFDWSAHFPPSIRAWPVAPKLYSLGQGWLDFWVTVMELTMSSSSTGACHLHSLLSPKWLHFAFQRPISYCMNLSDQILCPWCNTGGEVSPQAESCKTQTLEPLRSKHSWLSGKKKEGAFKNPKIECYFKFHFVTVRKLLWIRRN